MTAAAAGIKPIDANIVDANITIEIAYFLIECVSPERVRASALSIYHLCIGNMAQKRTLRHHAVRRAQA
jgi:hypothetical protein